MALRTLQVARPRISRGSLGVFVESWEVRKSSPSLGCLVCARRPSWHARWHESVEAVNSASATVSTKPTNDTSISRYRLQFLLHMHAHLCRHLRPAHWMQCAGFRMDRVRVWPRPSPAVFLSFCPVVPARSQNSCFMRQVHICFHTWTFSDSHIKAGVAEERPEISVGSCYSCRLDLCLLFSFLRI